MKGFLSVLRFTFLSRIRSKSFIATTALFLVIITIGINVPNLIQMFSSGGDKTVKVGMFDNDRYTTAVIQYFYNHEDAAIEIVQFTAQDSVQANEAYARQQVADKVVKGFLLQAAEGSGSDDFPGYAYLSRGTFMQQGDRNTLQEALQSVKFNVLLKDLGLTAEQNARLVAPVSINAIQVEEGTPGGEATGVGKTASEQLLSYILVYILMTLLFMTVSLYGNMTASEVTAEKSSRVMEILITSVSPLKQLFGKVCGMFLLGIVQLALFAAAAVINLNLPGNRSFFSSVNLHFGDISPMLYVYFVIFFLLGFFLYVILFAAIGSLVSRTEDLGQAVMPITFVALGAFYLGIYGVNDPLSSVVKVCSFIPFFTPSLMFLRIGMSGVPFWEIAVSIALLLLAIGFFGWLSAKVYRTGVLLYGKRPSMKELIKAMRA